MHERRAAGRRQEPTPRSEFAYARDSGAHRSEERSPPFDAVTSALQSVPLPPSICQRAFVGRRKPAAVVHIALPAQFPKYNIRNSAIDDLAQGEARLDPGNAREAGKLRAMDALEILDVPGHHNQNVIIRAGHQEASNHRRTFDDLRLERRERLVALALQRNPDQDRGSEVELSEVEDGLIALDVTALFQ